MGRATPGPHQEPPVAAFHRNYRREGRRAVGALCPGTRGRRQPDRLRRQLTHCPADPAASALAPVAVVGPPRRPNGTAAELAADVHWRGPPAQGWRLAKRRLGGLKNI